MTTVLRKDLSDPGNSRRKKGNQFLCIGSVALEKSDLPISCVLPVSLKGHKSECVIGEDKKGEKVMGGTNSALEISKAFSLEGSR